MLKKVLLFIFTLFILSCKKDNQKNVDRTNNLIQYASAFSINEYKNYSILTINEPWPHAKEKINYILKKKNAVIPDSLSKYQVIEIPLKSIIVTSTTNIPLLEMLGVENKLVGFPQTDFISSEKTRELIEQGKIKDVGQNESLNFEEIIELQPQLIVTFCVDQINPSITNLEKSGQKVLIQSDWLEKTPLGKAEWIKLFGALFGKEKKAKEIFEKIVSEYQMAKKLIEANNHKPNILFGSLYRDQWYVPNGESWLAQFTDDAKGNYYWKNIKGQGSTPLNFEKVFEKAKNADIWITSGFKNLAEMQKINPHYKEFKAFQNKKVYTFENIKGKTGGYLYYETAQSRPDLVLKDLIKAFHPELLKNYSYTFLRLIE